MRAFPWKTIALLAILFLVLACRFDAALAAVLFIAVSSGAYLAIKSAYRNNK